MKDPSVARGPLRQYRLPIAGMTCGACERLVEEALRRAGASEARADFRRAEARFSAPATRDVQQFVDALATTPYRAGQPEALARPGVATTAGTTGAPPEYDIAVIGSGAAAFAAAIHATERGARVVMIERGLIGGTCVNVGCVPSKTQLRAAEHFWQAGHQPFAGIGTDATRVDLPALVDQKDALVAELRADKYTGLIEQYGWELLRGEATFADHATLRVGTREVRAAAYIVATGARPAIPAISGLAGVDYLTSTTLLALRQLPRALTVIGAGYVGLELGQLFHHLGSRVTLLQRGERLLPEHEPEVSAAVGEIFANEGLDLITGATVLGVERRGDRTRLVVEVGGARRVVDGDALLVAAGRAPNTERLNAAAAAVALGDRGEILVDGELRTSNPRVFAAGDVTLGPQYVYVAARQGAIAAENALGGSRQVDLRSVPGVIFTAPAIATVGMTVAEAYRAGITPKASLLPLRALPRALVNHDARGLIKLVVDAGSDTVIGVQIVAENAGDAIYAGVLAVKHRLTVNDLTESFAPYLTVSEGLKLAAQAFGRDVAKLSCCAA